MISDAATLGALFLLVTLAPAWVSGASLASMFPADQAAIALAGLGVGALIRLVRSAVWTAVFSYARRSPSNWRREAGLRWVPTHAVASAVTRDEAETAMLTTSFELYGHAGPDLRDWIRRRHAGFATSIDAAIAIVAGLLACLLISPHGLSESGWLLWLVFLALTVATVRGGFIQRAEAEHMEEMWHRLNQPK